MIEQGANNIGQVRGAEVPATTLIAPIAEIGEPEAITTEPAGRSSATLKAIARNRKAVIGAIILLFFAAMAIFAPVISPGDPNELVARRNQAPSIHLVYKHFGDGSVGVPYWFHFGDYPFGTTGSGQDVLKQTIWGSRQSLGVGVGVGVLTTIVAALFGMTAGYFGGKIDDLMSLFMNVFLIIPSLPLLIVLVGFLGSGGALYFILVLAVTGWSWGARVLRSQTLSIREKDFIAAAEVSGESRFRIIIGEIFPNMISLVAANMFGATIYAIGAMAALQFLGLGNPSVVSWGTNLYWAQNNGALLTGAWWTVVPSGVSIALVAFAFALTNYAVDEVTNPRLKAQRVSREALAKLGGASGKKSRATPVIRHAN